MPVWLSTVMFLVGIAGAALCLAEAGRRKRRNAGARAAMRSAAVFGVLAVLSALYLAAAVLLLGGIS